MQKISEEKVAILPTQGVSSVKFDKVPSKEW